MGPLKNLLPPRSAFRHEAARRFAPAVFAVILAAISLTYGLYRGDSDLWYHLAAGRHILSGGGIPSSSSVFSFLTPVREYVDYYWLFQVAVKLAHGLTGYWGLLILRAVSMAGFVLLASALLDVGKGGDGKGASKLLALALISIVVFPRLLNLRPHLISLTALLFFLYVMERKRSLAPVLPLVSLVWMNAHGVTYPVLLTVCGLYLMEGQYLWRVRCDRPDGRIKAFLVASAAMVLATPAHVRLLPVPFRFGGFATQVIEELRPTPWAKLLAPTFHEMMPTQWTAFAFFAAMAVLAAITLGNKLKERPALPAFAAVGALMLFFANRFIYEASILMLPLISRALSAPTSEKAEKGPLWRAPLTAVAITLILLGQMVLRLDRRPALPFSPSGLPVGACAFLNTVDNGGRVLHMADRGGYYEWALAPRYSLTIDFQSPFLFTDGDELRIAAAYRNPDAMARLISEASPDYIAVPYGATDMASMGRVMADYAPVFFDDAGVLYASVRAKGEVARRYGIRSFDPYSANGRAFQDICPPEKRDLVVEELRRTVSVWPDGRNAAQWLAEDALARGNPAEALRLAESVIGNYPEEAGGYLLSGDSLAALGRNAEAASSYEKGLVRAREEEVYDLILAIGEARYRDGDMRGADSSYSKYQWLYKGGVPPNVLYHMADAAERTGKRDKAATLARFALAQLKPGDMELKRALTPLAGDRE